MPVAVWCSDTCWQGRSVRNKVGSADPRSASQNYVRSADPREKIMLGSDPRSGGDPSEPWSPASIVLGHERAQAADSTGTPDATSTHPVPIRSIRRICFGAHSLLPTCPLDTCGTTVYGLAWFLRVNHWQSGKYSPSQPKILEQRGVQRNSRRWWVNL